MEEVGGAGAEPPQNLTIAAEVVQTVLPLEWSGRKRGQDFFILFPVFGGEMATAKIQTVKGLRAVSYTHLDDLELDTLGDRKTALFLIMSDTDTTFNFVIAMLQSQLFNLDVYKRQTRHMIVLDVLSHNPLWAIRATR